MLQIYDLLEYSTPIYVQTSQSVLLMKVFPTKARMRSVYLPWVWYQNVASFKYLEIMLLNTFSSKKMDGILNRYNLKSTRRIYTLGFLKCSETFKVLHVP